MTGRGVTFNGRFLGARRSGVQRVAHELIVHLDGLLAQAGGLRRPWSMARPRGEPGMALSVLDDAPGGRLGGNAWEQLELPRLAGRDVLVNLCNTAPLSRRGDVLMIHDAQVAISPESYSPAFRAWYRFALPRIAQRAAVVMTVSEYSRDQLIAHRLAPADRLVVSPNGCDHMLRAAPTPELLERLGLKPRTYIVALFSAQKHKNMRVLLDAFASPALADLTLVLVGAETREDLTAAGFAAPPNCLPTGKVSDGDLRALYEGAACLAFPSTTEGFGLPPLEAMLCGCPVVAAPCGAVPEVCGDAALYAAPADPSAWASSLSGLARSGPERQAVVEKGRARAAGFTWDRSARRLLEVIEGVAARA